MNLTASNSTLLAKPLSQQTSHRSSSSCSNEPKIDLSDLSSKNIDYLSMLCGYERLRLLSHMSTNWILSTEDYRRNTEPPVGLICKVNPSNSNECFILLEEDPNIKPVDYRELHQLVRELMVGIYLLNETPSISMESNYEQTSTCQLPPAYENTKIGQLLIEVDYMMKSLWHGVTLPKEKRAKFLEKWRVSRESTKSESSKALETEFNSIGMVDLTKDPTFAKVYDKAKRAAPSPQLPVDRRAFHLLSDRILLQMAFRQESIKQHNNLFVLDTSWIVSSRTLLADHQVNKDMAEQFNIYLQHYADIVVQALPLKPEIRRNLVLLKLVSFLTPFLVGMRKCMKIPIRDRLLRHYLVDECRTESELPPLMTRPDSKGSSSSNHYHHLNGGISIDLNTAKPIEPDKCIIESYDEIKTAAIAHLDKMLWPDQPLKNNYAVPVQEIEGKRYYVITLEFETFYPPQEPLWVKAYHDELTKLKSKRPVGVENNIQEVLRKYFGQKRAAKCKNIQYVLRLAAQRGLVPVFQFYCRKSPSARSVAKLDEAGYSLLHHAAMYNRPEIIAILLQEGMDINLRRHNLSSSGPAALHLAAQCGSLDAVMCLVGNMAKIDVIDHNGWTPIHCAAFYNQAAVLELFLQRDKAFAELKTEDSSRSTPLLLAAAAGSLPSVKTLIHVNANVTARDSNGYNAVNLSVLHSHTHVVQYLLQCDCPQLQVWETFVQMLKNNDLMTKGRAVHCLEDLILTEPKYWQDIHASGGIPALADLLKIENEELVSVAASVLCKICEHRSIQEALSEVQPGPTLIRLLSSPVDDIQARVAIIISDLASNKEENQVSLAEQGAITALVNLLESEVEDVLLNTINAIRILCLNNLLNQSEVARCNGIEALVDFLTIGSDNQILESAAAAALAAISHGHRDNQNIIIKADATLPLVELVSSRNLSVQMKAARAIEALADNNPENQRLFLNLGTVPALIQFLKNINEETREQGACSLWSLAGHTRPQQKKIAKQIGVTHIIEMLLEKKSEKLLLVGCLTAIGLIREDIDLQNTLVKADILQQLVRLLRWTSISQQAIMMVIKVLGVLCVGVAYTNNPYTQKRIAEEGAVPALVHLLTEYPQEELQVEVLTTLACIVLQNSENQMLLLQQPTFTWDYHLHHLKSPDKNIRLRLCMASAIFSFNNISQQLAIREAGGISFSIFEEFLESSDLYFQTYAAFQIVVLARVIIGRSPVSLTASGISLLVRILETADDDLVVLVCSLLSSLAHTRAGITDAMVTVGILDLLVNRLSTSENPQVLNAVAVTLGYLTFNPTATRLLFATCRNVPGLYKKLKINIGVHPKINSKFEENFRLARLVGLPSQCLEINGGRPVIPPSRSKGAISRSQTSIGRQRFISPRGCKTKQPRSKSAMVAMQAGASVKTWNPTSSKMPAFQRSKTVHEEIVPIKELSQQS